MDYNLDSFKPVDSVNFTGKDVSDIVVTKDGRFRFSPFAFSELGLAENSLDERKGTDGIVLVTMPGNTGRFYRSIANKKKQRTVKNDTLLTHLKEVGITGNNLSLTKIGNVGTSAFYLIGEVKKDVAA